MSHYFKCLGLGSLLDLLVTQFMVLLLHLEQLGLHIVVGLGLLFLRALGFRGGLSTSRGVINLAVSFVQVDQFLSEDRVLRVGLLLGSH